MNITIEHCITVQRQVWLEESSEMGFRDQEAGEGALRKAMVIGLVRKSSDSDLGYLERTW
jgi:hypothetical protein